MHMILAIVITLYTLSVGIMYLYVQLSKFVYN